MKLYRKWKMALNAEGVPYLLFDLEHDPSEIHNLAGTADAPDIETELRLRILEHLVQTQLQISVES